MATTVYTNNQYYTDIAEAIRSKNGSSTQYKPSEMAPAINALIVSGSAPRLQAKSINPTTSSQVVKYDSGYNGLSQVTVGAIQTETKTVTTNGDVTPTSGKYLTKVTVNVPVGSTINNQNKTVTPSTSQQTITADSGYTGLGTVTVNAMASGSVANPTATKGSVSNNSISVTPKVTVTAGYVAAATKTGTAVTVSASELVSGNKAITANGTNIDVTNYKTVSVNVPTSSGITPTGDLSITTNGTYDVTNYASAIVNVPIQDQ